MHFFIPSISTINIRCLGRNSQKRSSKDNKLNLTQKLDQVNPTLEVGLLLAQKWAEPISENE